MASDGRDWHSYNEALVRRGELSLDSLKGKGKGRATLHAAPICIVMLGVAKTEAEIGRPDLMRCVKCFQA